MESKQSQIFNKNDKIKLIENKYDISHRLARLIFNNKVSDEDDIIKLSYCESKGFGRKDLRAIIKHGMDIHDITVAAINGCENLKDYIVMKFNKEVSGRIQSLIKKTGCLTSDNLFDVIKAVSPEYAINIASIYRYDNTISFTEIARSITLCELGEFDVDLLKLAKSGTLSYENLYIAAVLKLDVMDVHPIMCRYDANQITIQHVIQYSIGELEMDDISIIAEKGKSKRQHPIREELQRQTNTKNSISVSEDSDTRTIRSNPPNSAEYKTHSDPLIEMMSSILENSEMLCSYNSPTNSSAWTSLGDMLAVS
ncbi:MAG: hypothetical protein ACH344_00410 [Yersinia sp. (in: enterobacteria)]